MINVIGLGYIGLPTTLMFAAHGQTVVGTDYDLSIVESLNAGKVTFEEDGLEELFSSAIGAGVSFSSKYQEADFYIISVPTPYDAQTKKIDTRFVESAVTTVLSVCPDDSVIVIESTVSPGTIDRFVRPLVKDRNVHLAHAPERIIPGSMLKELTSNPRTIGADDPAVALQVKGIYACFCEADIAVTDIRTAELSKVAENTFRDVNIAYANELARICHDAGLDVYELIRIANMHPRVNILQPGPGVGGHCISVDPWFLVGDFPEVVDIVHAARRVNDGQPRWILKRIKEVMAEHNIKDFAQVGLYGLTYKENVDDVRESPTLQLLEAMDESGQQVAVYDPYVKTPLMKRQYFDFDEFIDDVDLVVVMVGHDEIHERANRIAGKVVYDTRRACDTSKAVSL